MEHIGHLPVAVRRALQEKTLREERDRAKNGLGHSEARYHTTSRWQEHLSYGFCTLRPRRQVSRSELTAMVKMLG